jgi:predicted NBD/HSP70 family sugar kinase
MGAPAQIRPARVDVARDINRRMLLSLIRTRQPLSRADLSRISGLHRTTISPIMDELIEQRWVQEGPAGRQAAYLRLNAERTIIGVDLQQHGATIALSDLNGHFSMKHVVTTPEVVDRVQSMIGSGKTIEGIGICGRASADVRSSLTDATGLDVAWESPANACVIGNTWFGAAEEICDTVVVTVADEIDAGILSNGQLVLGRNGRAGEYGHVQLDPNGPPCDCGGRGCWTVFASNRAAIRWYSGNAQAQDLRFGDLLNLAEWGDTAAAKALETMAYWLGAGFRMIVAGAAPERILVVGDVARAWNRLNTSVTAGLMAHSLAEEQIPQIVPVQDGEAARLRGAVALVLQKRFAAG